MREQDLMRFALSIGIDGYQSGALSGCDSDARQMAKVLSTHWNGTPNFTCKVVTAPRNGRHDLITRWSLRDDIQNLLSTQAEVVLLYYAGHGKRNQLGAYLIPQDARRCEDGISMSDILAMANASPAKYVVIILDCCYSGDLGYLPVLKKDMAILGAGVSIVTACRGDQTAVEWMGGGVFTSLIVEALYGAGADLLGHVTSTAMSNYAQTLVPPGDPQPQFKANLPEAIVLRKCEPEIPTEVLLSLPRIFATPRAQFSLSPEYVESHQCRDPVKTAIFSLLQALNRERLVIPIDAPHMMDAALQSKSCGLTALGQRYWHSVKCNRI